MSQILTQDQAQAVATVISTMAASGGRATRLMFRSGYRQIRILHRRDGDIFVLRIDEHDRVTETRSYSNLAYFAAQHQGAA